METFRHTQESYQRDLHGLGDISELLNGGFIAFPFFSSPTQGLISLAIGVVVTAVVLSVIKKPVTEEDEGRGEDLGRELSDEGLDEIESL